MIAVKNLKSIDEVENFIVDVADAEVDCKTVLTL